MTMVTVNALMASVVSCKQIVCFSTMWIHIVTSVIQNHFQVILSTCRRCASPSRTFPVELAFRCIVLFMPTPRYFKLWYSSGYHHFDDVAGTALVLSTNMLSSGRRVKMRLTPGPWRRDVVRILGFSSYPLIEFRFRFGWWYSGRFEKVQPAGCRFAGENPFEVTPCPDSNGITYFWTNNNDFHKQDLRAVFSSLKFMGDLI